MSCYAIIRQPHADHAYRLTQTCGEPEEIANYASLNSRSGFVFAPFVPSSSCPILLIKPDCCEEIALPNNEDINIASQLRQNIDATERQRYAHDFALFHQELCEGSFCKLVLARSTIENIDHHEQPEQLFLRACSLYPRMFIALIHTRKGGTWLMATPEILIEGSQGNYSTMALAGSMRLADVQMDFDTQHGDASQRPILWDKKNTEEQQVVATYIGERLQQLATHIEQTLPYTIRAGRMVHLRTDFHFHIADPSRIGDIIDCLHPTPAVCGMPKQEAQRFILENESCERKYYSGFCGLLSFNGETRLYVSLRCMEMVAQGYRLYAGGGLLKESIENKEWQETQDKMDTMRMVLQSSSTFSNNRNDNNV